MRQVLLRSVVLATVIAAVSAAAAVLAENVDPSSVDAQYAWGENVGWINAEPSGDGGPGATVSGTGVTGYMWGENVGWISLSCVNNDTCLTADFGVTNDGAGNLSGYAWGENIGWISFSCVNNPSSCATTGSYGVHIDPATGIWSGHAWGENIGWINFQHGQAAYRITSDDGDGVPGASDNCPFDNNGSQTNTDAGNTAMNFPGTDSLGDGCDNDDDGDGCSDAEELGINQDFGGQRNPLSVWDFYDVNGDARIDLNDTLDILAHFGHGTTDDPLDNLMDRMVPGGAQPWQTVEDTSGNGIDLTDALDNLASFGHDCSGPP